MFKRPCIDTVKERLAEPRAFIQVLSGPRQIGKSTLIAQVLSETTIAHTSVAADGVAATDSDWIAQTWQSARNKMDVRHEAEHLLVIDEVQKIANWSEYVKREWDIDTRDGRNLKVVLLGSSRLMLMKGLTESLAGRFEMIRMGHWDYAEMQEAFGVTLDQYIYFGGYPGAAKMTNNETRWKSYVRNSLVDSAITNDVLMTSNIYKPALIRQLFELGCSYSGELLSLNKMLGQLQDAGNVTTLAGYLAILNQCNMLVGLQKYAADNSRKYASIPKYQVYNNALRCVYSADTFSQARIAPKIWGRYVESAVGAHLVNHADAEGYKVFYWREKDAEVDFVIERGRTCIAIEVKSGTHASTVGLSAFAQAFNPLRTIIVGTDGIDLEEFFSLNPASLL